MLCPFLLEFYVRYTYYPVRKEAKARPDRVFFALFWLVFFGEGFLFWIFDGGWSRLARVRTERKRLARGGREGPREEEVEVWDSKSVGVNCRFLRGRKEKILLFLFFFRTFAWNIVNLGAGERQFTLFY